MGRWGLDCGGLYRLMRYCAGSQWSWMRTEVMWSNDLVQVMIRTAEFWMICSLLLSLQGSPERRACNKWVNRDFGAGLGQWWAESGEITEVGERSPDDILNMGANERVSRIMPRPLTWGEKVTGNPSTMMGGTGVHCSLVMMDLEPMSSHYQLNL